MDNFFFDEIIDVIKFDNQVVYDKVSRMIGESEDKDFYLELDVHTELYPMHPGDKYRMVISDTLRMDGAAEGEEKSLADKFEYVMHGLLYKMSEAKDKHTESSNDIKIVVYISFGGLQLMLKGELMKMKKFSVDQRLFLLLRKI